MKFKNIFLSGHCIWKTLRSTPINGVKSFQRFSLIGYMKRASSWVTSYALELVEQGTWKLLHLDVRKVGTIHWHTCTSGFAEQVYEIYEIWNSESSQCALIKLITAKLSNDESWKFACGCFVKICRWVRSSSKVQLLNGYSLWHRLFIEHL